MGGWRGEAGGLEDGGCWGAVYGVFGTQGLKSTSCKLFDSSLGGKLQ